MNFGETTLKKKNGMKSTAWSKVVYVTILLSTLIANDTLQVDIINSTINWEGRKVTGEHSGTLKLSTGWVVMNKTTLIDGKLIFDMSSISNTDIESPEWSQKLENHLKAEDFFYVDSFPYAILEIKGNQPLSDNKSKANNQILADLTIRGITKEISLPILIQQSDSNFSAIGTIDIDRTLYNIQYKSGKFFEKLGDKMIYDDFTVQFFLITK